MTSMDVSLILSRGASEDVVLGSGNVSDRHG